MTGQMITVRSAATRLAVTTKRVYAMIAAGQLETIRLGPRSTRILLKSLDQLISDRLTHQKCELGLDIKPQHPQRNRPWKRH